MSPLPLASLIFQSMLALLLPPGLRMLIFLFIPTNLWYKLPRRSCKWPNKLHAPLCPSVPNLTDSCSTVVHKTSQLHSPINGSTGVRQDASLSSKERRFRLERMAEFKEHAWRFFLDQEAMTMQTQPQIHQRILDRTDEQSVEVTEEFVDVSAAASRKRNRRAGAAALCGTGCRRSHAAGHIC